MAIIDILILTTIICFFLALIPYVVGRCLEKKEETKSKIAYLITGMLLAIGVAAGLTTVALDTYQEHATEYVECERCGSRVPAAEYETGE